MQAVWMLLATLGLASAGVLGLALVTQVAAWGEAPMILTAHPLPVRGWVEERCAPGR
ncbi:MAG: hypothetical protein K0S88_5507 [Actinomycetia bacterium]|nr:hypothetical protein [Actinomycetes bacterium]